MSQKSNELTAQGFDVINLSVGEPDFTTPEHIKLIVDAVRALSPGRRTVSAITVEERSVEVEPVPLKDRSRFGSKLARGEFVTSVEIVPPKGCDPAKMLEGVRLLKEAGVAVVPGTAFGSDQHIRLSYACSDDTIAQGMAKFTAFVRELT